MTNVIIFILILILGFSGAMDTSEYTDICGNKWKNGKRVD